MIREPGLKLLGIVLCGGRSTRMGRDKADLKTPSGRNFVTHAYERLRPLCDAVFLSASADRVTPYPTIKDPPDARGPMTGILCSLNFALQNDYDACVFNPIDTPNLTDRDISVLIECFRKHPKQIVCAAVDGDPKHLQPLIAVYPVDFAPAIVESMRQGHFSLRRFLPSQSTRHVSLSASACLNINTPSDLKHLSTDP